MASANDSKPETRINRWKSKLPKIALPKIDPPKIDLLGHCRKLKNKHIWRHFGMVWRSTFNEPEDPNGKNFKGKDFSLKTIVMIGATSDISAEAAIKIARLNAVKLIIGVGDLQRGNALKDRIEREAGRSNDFCVVLELDMTSFPSIEQFVNDLQKATPKVHAVILDVSLQRDDVADAYGRVARSPQGTELQLQVNVISTAYLAIFLLALLVETSLGEQSPCHFEFVGCERYKFQHFQNLLNSPEHSILQYLNKFPEDAIQFPATKFLQMGIMFQLAKRVDPSSVIIFDAEPGSCEKHLWNGRNWGVSQCARLGGKCVFARTVEQGSRILVSGLFQRPRSNYFQNPHGRVYEGGRPDLPLQYVSHQNGDPLSDAVFLELIARFRQTRNWRAIKCIVPDGEGRMIDTDRIQNLRIWHSRWNGFPLSGDEDNWSFWREALRDVISENGNDYEHNENVFSCVLRPSECIAEEETKESVDERVVIWLDRTRRESPGESVDELAEEPSERTDDEETVEETRRKIKGKQIGQRLFRSKVVV